MQSGTITNTKIELIEYFNFLKDNMVFKEMDIKKDRINIIFKYDNKEHHIIYFFNYDYITVKLYIGIINTTTVMLKRDSYYNIRELIYDYFLFRDDIDF